MKIGYSFALKNEPGTYSVELDKDAVQELIKVSERNIDIAANGHRYDDIEEWISVRRTLVDLIKEPEVPELDRILTE